MIFRILPVLFLVLAVPELARAESGPVIEDTTMPASRFFCSHRPTYFAVGDPTTRIQLSFRYAIWVDYQKRTCFEPSERDIEFGYTQTSLWRIFDESLPFEENNYNPELYYRENFDRLGSVRWLNIGLEHESNGRAGDISRAWNRVYLSSSIGSKHPTNGDSWRFRFEPKVWAILSVNLEEGAIPYNETIGYTRLDFDVWTPATRYGDGLFELTLYKGGVFDLERFTVLAGVSWNFWHAFGGSSWWGFTPDLYAQYFQGWAETLENSVFFSRSVRFGLRMRK